MKQMWILLDSIALAYLGVWIVLMPFALGFDHGSFAFVNTIVIGALVIAGAIASAILRRPGRSLRQTLTRGFVGTMLAALAGFYGVVVCFVLLLQRIGRFDTLYVLLSVMAAFLGALMIERVRMTELLRTQERSTEF